MTTIAAWISRGNGTSLFIASDSRYTWNGCVGAKWDCGRKIFGAPPFPDLLAFCGDAVFCSTVIANAAAVLARGKNDKNFKDFAGRAYFLSEIASSALDNYPFPNAHLSKILHATNCAGRIEMRVLTIENGKLMGESMDPKGVEGRQSSFVGAFGSGAVKLKKRLNEASPKLIASQPSKGSNEPFQPWAAWQALVAVTRDGAADPLTGGPVQAMSVDHRGHVVDVGVFDGGGFNLAGAKISNPQFYSGVEWRDSAYNYVRPEDGRPLGKRIYSYVF